MPVVGIVLYYFPLLMLGILLACVSLYLLGYRIDLIKGFEQGGSIEEIPYRGNYNSRMRDGLVVATAQFLYMMPASIVMVVSYISIFLGIEAMSGHRSTNEGAGLGLIIIIVAAFFLLVGFVVNMILQIFLMPILQVSYIKYKSFSKLFDFQHIYKLIASNWVDLLLIWAVMTLVNILTFIAIYFSAFLVILCVGLFIFPVVTAISKVYQEHVQAELLGKLSSQIK